MTSFNSSERHRFVCDCRSGTIERIDEWLARGMPVDAEGHHGKTALYAASQVNDLAAARKLIARGANPNKISNRLHPGAADTPLHAACINGSYKVLDLLLAHGARPTILDRFQRSAAHALLGAWKDRLAFRSVGKGKPDNATQILMCLDKLLAAGASLDQMTKEGVTLLSIAICQGAPLTVIERLLEKGANPNQRFHGGGTAVHEAALASNLPALRLLSVRGADVNAIDDRGRTAIFAATQPTICELLALGGDPNRVDLGGQNALMVVLNESIIVSSTKDHVAFLLEVGCSPTQVDERGRTAIDIARQRQLPDIEAVILAWVARTALRATARRPSASAT